MSLTSQLKNRNSPVCQFFSAHEHKQGMTESIAFLLSSHPFLQTEFVPPFYVYGIIGTASDYLIRYIANGNKINFKKIIAAEAVKRGEFFDFLEDEDYSSYLRVLFDIGQFGLRGQTATSSEAIVSSLALALLDNYYRSGLLPKAFFDRLSASERKKIRSIQYGKSYQDKKIFYQLFKYLEDIGGDLLVREIAAIANLFETGLQDSQSEIYGIKFEVYNKALYYSNLVGGADFDCVIRHKGAHILTEIKTIKKNLNIDYLRQLLGYSLLYSRSKDRFSSTHLGVYYSRACSFRYVSVDFLITKCFPTFVSSGAARAAFRKFLKESTEMEEFS